jgi:superfamily II DNA or RNA helicase
MSTLTPKASLERLRTLVDHGAADPKVDQAIIDGQLQTAAALHVRLLAQGGVILGDEVGAGKTYVAMALIVEALEANPDKGAVILVPKPALVSKWAADLKLYLQAAVRDEKLARRLKNSISPINRGLGKQKRGAIVIGQQSLFMGRLSNWDCAAVLRSYLRERSGRERMHYLPWLRACGITGDAATSPDWASDWATAEVFERTPSLLSPLDHCFAAYDRHELLDHNAVRGAVGEIRRKVARQHLPRAALLVIDEAHHLRNTATTKYWTMMEVLEQRFDSLLFMTATPFQMGPAELRNVVSFSKSAVRGVGSTGDGDELGVEFDQKVIAMTAAMENHVYALATFGRAWSDLTDDEAQQAQAVMDIGVDPTTVPPHVALTAELFEGSLETKDRVEAALRPFLIRSVREHFRTTRPGLREGLEIESASRVPLALVDRMLYEVFEHGSRTFVASVLLGATSSFHALAASALMTTEDPAGSASRRQLKRMEPNFGPHPKVESTVASALAGVEANEKVLIFVERVQTGSEIARRLNEALGETTGSEDERRLGRRALQDRSRTGWAALRENYLHTVYPLVFHDVIEQVDLERLAAEHDDLFQRCDSVAHQPARDYAIEKRFWEHVLFSDAVDREPKWRQQAGSDVLAATVDRVLHADYILNGLDLVEGDSGQPRHAEANARSGRKPQMDFARAYLGHASPWKAYERELAEIDADHRARFVDAVARAIALSHLRVAFVQAESAGSAEAAFSSVMEIVSTDEWHYRLNSLVDLLAAAGQRRDDEAEGLDPVQERVDRLVSGLLGAKRVQFISGNSDETTWQNAIQGFNTPMYPDVLVATDVLGEGIDLHRHCRHVIHHDLPWNPAKLEQRTGRVDRIGSYSEHLRADKRPDSDILVDLPYVAGTYDAFIYSQVMSRERVFRWLLGYRPEWDSDTVATQEPPPPVPENWIDRLQIRLGPEL